MKNTSLLVFLPLCLLLACQAREATVMKQPIPAPELGVFPPESFRDVHGNLKHRLLDTKIFLWKNGVPPAKVATTIRLSDSIEALQVENKLLDRDLTHKLGETTYGEWKGLWMALSDLKTSQRQVETDLSQWEEELAREKNKSDEPVDPEKIASLEKRIERGQTELAEVTENIRATEEYVQGMKATILEQQGIDITEAQGLLDRNSKAAEDMLSELTFQVDLFNDGPDTVLFQFDAQLKPNVYFSDWNACLITRGEGIEKRASTEGRAPQDCGEFKVGPATYQEVGGLFEFSVTFPLLRERYEFTKVARNHYEDPFGRISYQGNVKVFDMDSGTEKNSGVAKFSSQTLKLD